jgi:enoyl-CoA hydratase/carnithine racemase
MAAPPFERKTKVPVISYSCTGSIGTIEMDGPPANSYGISFVRELNDAIQAAIDDSACKVVIVRSALPGFFCGGADIKQFKANSASANSEMIALAHDTLNKPSQSEKVFIAEIAGHALGGGLEIALACDMRFAATGTYSIGLPEVALGLLPGNGGTQRLTSLVGVSKALELMVAGERLSPEEAHRLGIVNRLCDPSKLREHTAAFAQTLSQGATLAIGKIKRSVYDGQVIETGLAQERRNIGLLFASNDAREGFAAFVERRKPNFSGN